MSRVDVCMWKHPSRWCIQCLVNSWTVVVGYSARQRAECSAIYVATPTTSVLLSVSHTLPLPPPREGCKVLWWVPVCLFVHLSFRITRKQGSWFSPNFLCMLPVARAQFSSDSVLILLYISGFCGWHCVFIAWGQWTRMKDDVITSPLGGAQSIVMSMSVCLSVCLSVCSHNLKTRRPIFT